MISHTEIRLGTPCERILAGYDRTSEPELTDGLAGPAVTEETILRRMATKSQTDGNTPEVKEGTLGSCLGHSTRDSR